MGTLKASDTKVEVVGIYPIEAPEPCHLVELVIRNAPYDLDVGQFTQETHGLPPENWQVPWDEHFLDPSGTRPLASLYPDRVSITNEVRLAFFFQYLNLAQPLLTPFGPVELPSATRLPKRLRFVDYESPD